MAATLRDYSCCLLGPGNEQGQLWANQTCLQVVKYAIFKVFCLAHTSLIFSPPQQYTPIQF